jgi:hypothetical protein
MSIHLIARDTDGSLQDALRRQHRINLCLPVPRSLREVGLGDLEQTPRWLDSSERVLAAVGWVAATLALLVLLA